MNRDLVCAALAELREEVKAQRVRTGEAERTVSRAMAERQRHYDEQHDLDKAIMHLTRFLASGEPSTPKPAQDAPDEKGSS